MKNDTDVLQGTLALMVLKTLDVLGPLHGYGIARRIEQISGDLLTINQGTLYPVLLKLEQEGSIASDWGTSENNRRARFYRLTRDGRTQLRAEARGWERTSTIVERFFAVKAGDLK
jgi:PadR family transcriptional regulator, regulatory protein PadR